MDKVPLTQWDFAGGQSLAIWSSSFANNINNFFPLVMDAQDKWLNLNEEQPVSVH